MLNKFRKLLFLPNFKFSLINASTDAFVKSFIISCLEEFFCCKVYSIQGS